MTAAREWDAHVEGMGMTAREYVRRNAAHKTDAQIGAELSAAGFKSNAQSVQQRRINLGIAKDPSTKTVIRPSPLPRYDSPPRVEGNALVLADVEFPYHEHEFLNRVIELAQAWDIDHVVFAGDMLHHDQLSSWSPNWTAEVAGGIPDELYTALSDLAASLGKKGKDLRAILDKTGSKAEKLSGVSDEWALARSALRGMRDVFSEATLILGNHEGRLLSALDSPTSPDDLKRLVAGDDGWLKTAPYYWGLVQSAGVTYRVTHPRNVNAKPATVAAVLADKFRMHVLQAHSHLWGAQQSVSGDYIGYEIGCVVDPLRLPYAAQRDTTRANWTHGAAIIRDGHCWLLHHKWTDWERLMEMK